MSLVMAAMSCVAQMFAQAIDQRRLAGPDRPPTPTR
jgi:hypothetical protein